MSSQSGPIYSGTLTGPGGGLFARWRPLYGRAAARTFINGARFVNGVETRAGTSRAAQTGTRPTREREPLPAPQPFSNPRRKSPGAAKRAHATASNCWDLQLLFFFPANIFCVMFFFFPAANYEIGRKRLLCERLHGNRKLL